MMTHDIGGTRASDRGAEPPPYLARNGTVLCRETRAQTRGAGPAKPKLENLSDKPFEAAMVEIRGQKSRRHADPART
jgi:hypothetical protein